MYYQVRHLVVNNMSVKQEGNYAKASQGIGENLKRVTFHPESIAMGLALVLN